MPRSGNTLLYYPNFYVFLLGVGEFRELILSVSININLQRYGPIVLAARSRCLSIAVSSI